MDLLRWALDHEPGVRFGLFVGVFAAVAAWERVAPRRPPAPGKRARWLNNLALVAVNTALVRLAFPIAAVGMAAVASTRGWGLLNQLALPAWIALPFAIFAMDFVIWLQHVLFHAVPLLWRLHRVHHADPDYDLTTGARFHPLEILLSTGVKFGTIVLLGPPAAAVLAFEALLSGAAMFNHGNIRLPARVDRFLRWFLVTPDMHRVHHSVERDETDSNFGFNLPWWDRLFGTYRAEPRAGHARMAIGLRGHADPREVTRLAGMLALPFRR